MSWNDSIWEYSDVILEEIALDDLCKVAAPGANKFMYLQKTSYSSFKPLCDIVKGNLPTPETSEEADNLAQEMLLATEGILPPGFCQDFQVPFAMLVGVKFLESRQSWINIYSNNTHPLTPSFYNGYISDAKCAITIESGLEAQDCGTPFGCGVCLLEKAALFYLKGMCKADIDQAQWYDLFYYNYGLYNGKAHFMYATQ